MSGPRRREAYRRGLLCLGVLLVTFTLVCLDAPFVISLREVAFDLMFDPWAVNVQIHVPSFRARNLLAPSLLVTAVVTLPVLVYQTLAFATRQPYDGRLLVVRTLAVSVAFSLGLAVAYRLVFPALVAYRLRWDPVSITIMMSIEDQLYETLAVLLGGGLLFAAPLLLAFLAGALRARIDDDR